MDVLLTVKVAVVVVIFLIFILFALMTRGMPAGKMFLTNVIVFLVLAAAAYGATWVVDIAMKEATLVSVQNRKNNNLERLIVYGAVKNTGKFIINATYLEVKLVDNVTGKKASLRGESKDLASLGSVSHKCKITNTLYVGETQRFTCNIPYPPRFSLLSIGYDLSWR